MRGIKPVVLAILEADRRARNDDRYLYLKVVEKLAPGALYAPFAVAYMSKDMPSTESVRRCRQWCQEHYEDLRSDDNVEAARMLEEEEVREFVKHG